MIFVGFLANYMFSMKKDALNFVQTHFPADSNPVGNLDIGKLAEIFLTVNGFGRECARQITARKRIDTGPEVGNVGLVLGT